MKNVVAKVDEISKSFNSGKQYFNYLLLDSRYTKVCLFVSSNEGKMPKQKASQIFIFSMIDL